MTLLQRSVQPISFPSLVSTVVPRPAVADITPRAFRIGLALAFMVGAILRAGALTSNFPLNDGGLFYAMTRDLQAAHYHIPVATTYNNANIPFAYPPLGFYLSGLIDDATPMSLMTVFRVLPFALSLSLIPAFTWFASGFLPTRKSLLVATLVFAMFPLSYRWTVMGGSVTRDPGFLFALLALRLALDTYRERRLGWRVAALGVLGGLTVLSHLETGWFLACSLVLFAYAFGGSRTAVAQTVLAGMIGLVVSAPWWVTVTAQHGLSPLLAASRTGNWSYLGPIVALFVIPSAEPLFGLVTSLALLGAFAVCVERRFFLPAWVALAALFDPRAFPTFASVPVAILAAVGVCEVLLPFASREMAMCLHTSGSRRMQPAPRWIVPAGLTLGAALLFVSALNSMPRVLTGMSPDEQSAMSWVKANTDPRARVLVISKDDWSVDRTAEWFPTLTGRTSVATVQGYEWVDGGAYARRNDDAGDLRKCASRTLDCVDAWVARTGAQFDYVYVTKALPRDGIAFEGDDCCAGLRTAMRNDARYLDVYDGAGATVFLVRS